MIYMFDVDGTLTPSRGKIDPAFHDWFLDFCNSNPVFLVTGSDKPKTVEQIGSDIFNACIKVYNCSGNEVWKGDKRIHYNSWTLPDDAREWLIKELLTSEYKYRTGNHIEERTGMVNFSVVGRNANSEQRADYFNYDCSTEERASIASRFEEQFPELSAKVGGETGIDLFPYGSDKSQVLNDFSSIELGFISFYGDRCDPAGNDYPIALLLGKDQTYHVRDWHETWDLLRQG
jgi:phosphomannomutase